MNYLKLEKIYHTVKPFVPSRILYNNNYFKVRDLLRSHDNGLLNDVFFDNLLKEHLIYCIENVPFYNDYFKNSSCDFENINGNKLVKLFPFITKEDVNRDPDAFISRLYKNDKLMHSSSGGSTGVGIQVWYEKPFTDIERAFFDHEWGKLGFNFRTSKILRFGSDALKNIDEHPCEIIGRKLACSPYHFNNKSLPTIVKEAEKFSPEVLHGYPSLVYSYLSYLKENNLSLPLSLKGCFLASEPVMEHQLDLIRHFFGANYSINYGLTERNVIGFSTLLNSKVSYILNPVYGYYENYQTQFGDEIVGTNYWNKVMPLVRYRTKDYGTIEDGCVADLKGREQDFAITKQGYKIPAMSVAIDKFVWEFVCDIQLVQKKSGRLDILMVSKSGVFQEDSKYFIKFKDSLNKKWSSYFDMKFLIVDKVNVTKSGKKKLFIRIGE